jgi:hypothetical protein
MLSMLGSNAPPMPHARAIARRTEKSLTYGEDLLFVTFEKKLTLSNAREKSHRRRQKQRRCS